MSHDITLPVEQVRALFDLAFDSMDHGSGMLDTEDIAVMLSIAQRILPENDNTILDLQAERRRMAFPRLDPHEFEADRSTSNPLLIKCLRCGHSFGSTIRHPDGT